MSEHGDRCPCRHCASSAYTETLQRADYQRQELSRLQDENLQLRAELARALCAQLTAEIELAVLRGDKTAWARAIEQRERAQ